MTRRDAQLIAEELMKLQRYTEPYITRQEAAAYLSMTVAALDQYKDIPKHHIGRVVRFRKSEIDRWVASKN